MQIKSILDKRRQTKSGKYPVKIRISEKKKQEYISIGILSAIDEFDANSGFLILNKKNQREISQKNSLITYLLAQINDIIIDLRKNGKPVTADNIIKIFNEINTPRENLLNTFNSYFKKFIEQKKGRTKDIYLTTLRKIKKYFPGDIFFEDINKTWIKEFIKKMNNEEIRRKNSIQNGLSINAQGIHLRNIRAVFNEAIDDGVVGLEFYPFRKLKIEKEETRHRNISVEELRMLFNFSGTDSENYSRDIAILTFLLIGINASDLFNLSEISGGYASYRRSKTGRLYSIKIEPEAAELLDRFRGTKSQLIFKEQFINTANFLKKVNGETIYRNGKKSILKRGLNTIGEAIGVDGLTTYVLRHTWATIAGKLDIPKETIAQALGHGKKSVTDIYIEFDRSKIDDANRRVIDYVFNLI